MAEIRPFKGFCYTTRDVTDVLAPPYDVIDDKIHRELTEKSDHNSVRLILPTGDDPYENAAELLKRWIDSRVLAKGEKPAMYRYHQVFQSAGVSCTRKGFIAEVKLHEFDERVILRHERTLKGPKEDRLKLMKATRMHLSQIFTMYEDKERAIDALFAQYETAPPTFEGKTDDGTLHRVWVVHEDDNTRKIQKLLSDKRLYIADGHHRYETMLALRRWLKETGAATDNVDFGMMFLIDMADPGLVVLPTHRVIHSVKNFALEDSLTKLQEWFEIEMLPQLAADAIDELLESIKVPSFIVADGSGSMRLLKLKEGTDVATILGVTAAVAALDVAVLHGFVFEKTLGIDRKAQEAQSNLKYIKSTEKAVKAIASEDAQAVFFMKATPTSQVKAVADDDDVMPQKSTFYYPKIASGLVYRSVD